MVEANVVNLSAGYPRVGYEFVGWEAFVGPHKAKHNERF